MNILSVRDYRKNLAASFDRAAEGTQVIIRRRNQLYALISIPSVETVLSPEQKCHIDEMTSSIRRSWHQVQMIKAGQLPAKSAMDFIDEL